MTTTEPAFSGAATRIAKAYDAAAHTVWQLTGIGYDAGAVASEPLKQLRAAREQLQALELALSVFADLGGDASPAWASATGAPRWPDASASVPTPADPADSEWEW